MAEPTAKKEAAPSRVRRGLSLLLGGLAYFYLAFSLLLWLVLYTASDLWWVSTLLLFGPRWVWLVPLALLAFLALATRRRLWVPLGLALVVIVGPVMGLCVSWPSLASKAPAEPFRVLTCNVHVHDLNPTRLSTLLAVTDPDIVALQECRATDQPRIFALGDYHIQGGDGLCLASRFPILHAEVYDGPEFADGAGVLARYELDTPAGRVHLVSLHLASPRDGLSEVIRQRGGPAPLLEANSELRRRQSEEASRWVASLRGPLLIVGDFNTPVESTLYRQYWGQYTNAFSAAGFGFGNTHFTRRTGVRIDHILLGPGWHCRSCWVGPSVGSPHHPVLADVDWVGPADHQSAH